MDQISDRIIEIKQFYSSQPLMLKKYDKYARKDYFQGKTLEEFEAWKKETRDKLYDLIGMKLMETCELQPQLEERITLEDGIVREKVLIQVEPETWMPMFILIPPQYADPAKNTEKPECILAFPGHQGAGKYSVAGCYDIPAVKDKIEFFNYDYGMQLARRGYVAVCPDCRGFGERRDPKMQSQDEKNFMTGSCFHLAHMAEPIGGTVCAMLLWDGMRLIDYVYERGEWNTDHLGALGFSGGGMQTLWLAAMDDRIKHCIISGYLYGYKDSLMILNGNCNCNYVPHLWEHYDMGDIASLISPRPLAVQSCSEDHSNGPRGMDNVYEQMDIIKAAYELYGETRYPIHDVQGGRHCWHEEVLENLPKLYEGVR